MRKKELNNLLEERGERILVLEQRMENMNQQIEGYRAREQSIVESLATAQTESRQRMEAAQARANELIGAAQAQANSTLAEVQAQAGAILAEAQAQAGAILAEAQARADQILGSAKAESAGILVQARNAAAEYEQTNTQYQALLAQAAAQARASAEQFAMVIERCNVQFQDEADSAAPLAAKIALPDAQDDPAKLMQNIYTLQNRDIPESVQPRPDAGTPDAQEQEPVQSVSGRGNDGATEQEEIPDLAPRPEAEWQPEDEGGPAGEWQPETEPEMGDIPTVSELMPDMGDDELSLDALLDEIIKAGE